MLLIPTHFTAFCSRHRNRPEAGGSGNRNASDTSNRKKGAPQPATAREHQSFLRGGDSGRMGSKESNCYTSAPATHFKRRPRNRYLGRTMPNRSSRPIIFLVILVIIACGFGGAVYAQHGSNTASSDSEVRDTLKTFSQVYDIVEQNYAETVSPNKAIYNGAIPGMLHVLDPHSNFFDPKQYAQLREDQSGKYYGVGMQVGPRNNKVIVIAPFAGTPAYRAGMRPGDIIAAVDGKPTDNMNTSEVADLLKGPRNTNVRITILREGSDKPLDFNVVRDEIPRYSVDSHFLIRPGVGYLHINGFQETTEQEVSAALE